VMIRLALDPFLAVPQKYDNPEVLTIFRHFATIFYENSFCVVLSSIYSSIASVI
jgi:hypothetical protein